MLGGCAWLGRGCSKMECMEEMQTPEAEKKAKLESEYYAFVNEWAKDHFGFFKTAINRGLRYGRIDVLGVRDVGGDLSGEIESIAIEVKRGRTPFAVACGQTLGYRVYTNRVYLADVRLNSFNPDEVHIASNLGIGLIQMKDDSCLERLSSPFYTPITKLNLALMESIRLGKCSFCDSFFDIGDEENVKNTHSRLSRENLKRAVSDEKGMMFWHREGSHRKNQRDEKRANDNMCYDRRFVCSECIQLFFAHSHE